MVRIFNLMLLALLSMSVFAADISVKTDRNPVALDETFSIIFTVEGSQDDEPDFSPLNKDFQLLGTSQSSSFSIINGSMSRSKTYTLTVAPNRKGQLSIPAISFGKDRSPARKITVTSTASGQPGATPSPAPGATAASGNQLFITVDTDNKNPYVQQQVILTLKIYRRVEWSNPSLADPEFEGVEAAIQSLGKEKNYEASYKGERYAVTEVRYALFPQQSGQLTIKPFRLTARIPSGKQRQQSSSRGAFNDPFFDSFFSQTRQTYINKTVRSNAIKLDIKPIPTSFTGKQWLPAKDIKLKETWSTDIDQLQAGEPATRTVALIADGLAAAQLPMINFSDQSGLKHYPDQPVNNEQASDQGLLSSQSQKVAIIPSQGGQFKLPAIEIPWWNTKTDKMEIAKIPAQTLTATGSALTVTTNPPTTGQSQSSPTEAMQTPATTTTEQQPIPYRWLLIASGVLLALWLITAVAWLSSRRKVPTTQTINKEAAAQASLKQALKSLSSACQSKQTDAIHGALIQWGKAAWPEQQPNSLEEIATRVPQDLATEINNLSRTRYSQDQADWDADVILKLVKAFNPATQNSDHGNESDLEPLYR